MEKIFKIQKIVSPCISICRTDPRTGYCYGCARTNEDKKIWADSGTSNDWKVKNIQLIKERMSGWQLETFKESYENKCRKGFSLFKEKQLKEST
tara:strand:+ start:828 stop:1109 length:282 start_codon:yes stop_codon:yes gene_type:complete